MQFFYKPELHRISSGQTGLVQWNAEIQTSSVLGLLAQYQTVRFSDENIWPKYER